MVWLKNINKMRTIQVCKAFYVWKFYQPTAGAPSTPRQHHHSPHHGFGSPGMGNNGIVSGAPSVAGDQFPPSPSLSENGEEGAGGEGFASNSIPFQSHHSHQQQQMHHSTSSTSIHQPQSSLTEHKQSYLLLFAENEKLREQVHEIRKNSAKTEKTVRSNATRSILQTFFKKWAATRIRYYFDIWFNNNRMLRLIAHTSHQSIELAVGLQQVESEREYVRKTEHSNTSLRMLLCLTIYFFKWKSKIANRILFEERKQYEEQRRIIFKELRKMRELVTFANEQEVAVLHNAMSRGQDATQHLLSVKEKLAKIVKQSKTYRSTQITPDMLSNLVQALNSSFIDDGNGSVQHPGSSHSGKPRIRDKDRQGQEESNNNNKDRSATTTGGGGGGGHGNASSGTGGGKSSNTERTPDMKRSTRKISGNPPLSNSQHQHSIQQQSPAGGIMASSSPPPPPPPPPIAPLSLQTLGL
jgi:uncharacterized membrane protein YgcG